MRNTVLPLFLFFLASCSEQPPPKILTEEYSFFLTDGEVSRIKQSSDTLFEFNFQLNRPCRESRHKILSSINTADFVILKVKNLDNISLQESLCPGKIYSIKVIKKINKNQLGYFPYFDCLTLDHIDTIDIKTLNLGKRRFFTYFSDTYLREPGLSKRITSIDNVREIINAVDKNDFDRNKFSYSAEELNQACITMGYSPAGAGLIIDSFLKKRYFEKR
jgi:hypothetical protein